MISQRMAPVGLFLASTGPVLPYNAISRRDQGVNMTSTPTRAVFTKRTGKAADSGRFGEFVFCTFPPFRLPPPYPAPVPGLPCVLCNPTPLYTTSGHGIDRLGRYNPR